MSKRPGADLNGVGAKVARADGVVKKAGAPPLLSLPLKACPARGGSWGRVAAVGAEPRPTALHDPPAGHLLIAVAPLIAALPAPPPARRPPPADDDV